MKARSNPKYRPGAVMFRKSKKRKPSPVTVSDRALIDAAVAAGRITKCPTYYAPGAQREVRQFMTLHMDGSRFSAGDWV